MRSFTIRTISVSEFAGRESIRRKHDTQDPENFGFRILDFGLALPRPDETNPKSKIQNPKSLCVKQGSDPGRDGPMAARLANPSAGGCAAGPACRSRIETRTRRARCALL